VAAEWHFDRTIEQFGPNPGSLEEKMFHGLDLYQKTAKAAAHTCTGQRSRHRGEAFSSDAAPPVVFAPRMLRDQGNVQPGSRGTVQPR
jgi:hypothetical protein